MFPKRYRRARPPEYDDLTFRLLANPTGALYDTLLMGDASTPERKQELGSALVEAYGGETVEGYGMTFDFSNADAAIATITAEQIPVDLRAWLRNAPIDIVAYERDEIAKNFRASLIPGT
jgi:hypothetical protein